MEGKVFAQEMTKRVLFLKMSGLRLRIKMFTLALPLHHAIGLGCHRARASLNIAPVPDILTSRKSTGCTPFGTFPARVARRFFSAFAYTQCFTLLPTGMPTRAQALSRRTLVSAHPLISKIVLIIGSHHVHQQRHAKARPSCLA